jgi:3-oxoadipate enol-lactonase
VRVREVAVGSRKLRFLQAVAAGDRPRGTLVLIHAFPLNARMWEPQLSLAAAGWRVIAPQLRGFDDGASDPPAASIDDYAGDVIDLLDALGIDEAVIGGLSLGGYVTFALFRHAPRYFLGMVLADTRPQSDSPQAAEGRKRLLQVIKEKGAAAVPDEMLPRLLGQSTQRQRPDVVERVRKLAVSNSAGSMSGALMAMMARPDSTPILSTIHCPTLVLVGEEDQITPPDISREMHMAIAGSELKVIEGAGHLASVEQPEAFNGVLAHFLEHRV